MENKIELKNDNVYIRINKEGIYARDLTDKYNDESMFTQSKRGLKTPIKEIVLGFCPTYTFQTVINHISAYNIKYHRYCAID